jgi:hypothetical protein
MGVVVHPHFGHRGWFMALGGDRTTSKGQSEQKKKKKGFHPWGWFIRPPPKLAKIGVTSHPFNFIFYFFKTSLKIKNK